MPVVILLQHLSTSGLQTCTMVQRLGLEVNWNPGLHTTRLLLEETPSTNPLEVDNPGSGLGMVNLMHLLMGIQPTVLGRVGGPP